mmetsp:Transcript_15261/g.42131  ORF Transcript_15261/g.42131 Transcript_15261/m.42131 type:complete len:271 (-) Transcript_15261:243-1055(-)
MQGREPLRRARQQVQRDDIGWLGRVGVERLADRVLGLELGVGVTEAGLDGAAVELHIVRLDTGVLQRGLDAGLQRGVDLDGDLGAGHLHRGRLAEQVGQRVEGANQQRDEQDRVLPERIAVHGETSLWAPGRRRQRGRRWRRAGLLQAALGENLGDRTALDLQLDAVGHFQVDEVVAQLGDLADHAADRHDLVALGQGFDHGLLLLLALHLRPDHDEIEHDKHQHQGQHAEQAGLGTGGGRGGLGVGVGDEHGEFLGEMRRRAPQGNLEF